MRLSKDFTSYQPNKGGKGKVHSKTQAPSK